MIDPLITNPKQDNDLQLARTASIPANEKYQAKEWNAIIDKINEIINDLDLGQITDSVTKTTATNIVRLVEGALIETNLTIRNLPAATTEQKMILLNSLGEAALADISDYGGELKKIGDGYGLQHQIDNPTYYGTLGENAVNLSFSGSQGNFGATGDYSHAEGGNTIASGGSAHAEGINTTASGLGSHSEGLGTTASGDYSHAEGYLTTAGSYAENARGSFNEIITPIDTEDFNENDVVESVGVGINSARKNALTRWKNGAFKWLLQPLTNITNAVLGFHAADEDGRLNYYDGTDWKKYLLEGEGGSGIQSLGEETTQEDFQTMASGVYHSIDNTILGHLNFNGFVKISEWEYNLRTIEITGWSDNAEEFQSHFYTLKDNQDTTFTLTYKGNAFIPNSIQVYNSQDNFNFWTGTQAEYDAQPTKNPTTLYIIN